MACSDYSNYQEFLFNEQFADFFICGFQSSLGGPLAAFMFWAPIAFGFYIIFESVSVPVAATVLIGSVVVSSLPGGAAQTLGVVTLLLLTGLVYLLTHRARARV